MINPVIDDNGDQWWHNEAGRLHRDDGPAMLSAIGEEYWHRDGMLHRTDGPAIITLERTYWYVNNQRCRAWNDFQVRTGLSDEEVTLLILKYGEINLLRW